MSDEPDDGMAAILAANPIPEAETKPEGKPALELSDDDEAVDVPEGEEGGEEAAGDAAEHESRPRRSKPASQRIAELTARLRETERERDLLKAPPQAEAKAPEKPNPEDFEFGEADPGYIDKLTDWKIETRDHEKRTAEAAQTEQRAMVEKFNEGLAKAETDAKAKYKDFDTKLAEAVEARGGEPLPPLVSLGIAASPVGSDLIYRLATDEAASERLEKLAKGGAATVRPLALALGELEGEYLTDDSDSDLDLTDDLDVQRMLGRMKARLRGAKPKVANDIAVTNAPEPPRHTTRGGAGKFEVGADTTDFAAFERKVNGKK